MIGITRKMDELGRIVIPKEMRRSMNIEESDVIMIKAVPTGVLLSPVKNFCSNCGSTEALTALDQFALCDTCLDRLNRFRKGAVDRVYK